MCLGKGGGGTEFSLKWVYGQNGPNPKRPRPKRPKSVTKTAQLFYYIIMIDKTAQVFFLLNMIVKTAQLFFYINMIVKTAQLKKTHFSDHYMGVGTGGHRGHVPPPPPPIILPSKIFLTPYALLSRKLANKMFIFNKIFRLASLATTKKSTNSNVQIISPHLFKKFLC